MPTSSDLRPVHSLVFHKLPDGSSVAVDQKHVVKFVDVSPPIVPQPGSRRGVMGVVAISGTATDVAVIDILWALGFTDRPQFLMAPPSLLVVTGEKGAGRGDDVTLALVTDSPRERANAAPVPFDVLSALPASIWEPHPGLGGVMRRAPAEEGAPDAPWLLDPQILTGLIKAL